MRLKRASPAWRVRNDRQRLDELQARLGRSAGAAAAAAAESSQQALAARFEALNPQAVLQRGYALVRSADGKVRAPRGAACGRAGNPAPHGRWAGRCDG